MNKTDMFDAWIKAQAVMPFTVMLIALFVFIMMIALIANTNAIEKRIMELQNLLKKEAESKSSESDQGGNERT